MNAPDTKHERELQLQHLGHEQKLQNLNKSYKSRLEFCKHRIQTEKTRAQNYRDTIKDMAVRMDKVGQKNSNLWQRAK